MNTLRRVLVIEPYGIGDLLFLTPVLRALRLVPSIERVDMVLGSRTESMIRSNPHVDDLFPIDKDLFSRRSWKENFKELAVLTRTLRNRRYDLVLDYSQRREYGFWSAVCLGIPLRAGFAYKTSGLFLNRKISTTRGFEGKHASEFFSAVAEAAGIRVQDRWMEFYVTREARGEAKRLLQDTAPYLALAPGGGESWGKDAHFKRWPAERFAELAEKLKTKIPFRKIVLLGSAGEQPLAGMIAQKTSVPVLNLAGACPLMTSAAVLEKAALFLGNDGGLMHMANALHVPVIALFGPVDPQVYGPYPPSRGAQVIVKHDLACRPCYHQFRYKSDCTHRDCLQALSVEESWAQILEREKELCSA